ncbi:hypothetical protein A2U01_0097656, partial [Trifolium medium]|nr:hypothetical protein [Trifolium medium]
IAFVSNTDEDDVKSNLDTDESLSDVVELLGRQFNKILKSMDRRPRTNATANARASDRGNSNDFN